MGFEYNYLEDVDVSKNKEIIDRFNNILQKNNINPNLEIKMNTINSEFKEDKTPYNKVIKEIRWNTYYYKKYRQQTKLLVFIIFICIFIIILTKIKATSSYFDDKAYTIIIGTILAIAFIYLFYGLWDILFKDDKNFDEYAFSKYGGGGGNSKLPVFDTEDVDISNCTIKQLITPESINSSFLNKYF
jgi:hypothetical protein